MEVIFFAKNSYNLPARPEPLHQGLLMALLRCDPTHDPLGHCVPPNPTLGGSLLVEITTDTMIHSYIMLTFIIAIGISTCYVMDVISDTSLITCKVLST